MTSAPYATDPAFDYLRDDLEGLDEGELHDLIERAQQINALTNHPGWLFLQDYLVSLTTTSQKRILSGGCKNIEEYRVQTGYVRGLQASLEAVDKLQARIAAMRERIENAA